MKHTGWHIILFLALALGLYSCMGQPARKTVHEAFSDSLVPQYAGKFRIYFTPEYTVFRVFSPWQGGKGTTVEYLLANNTASLPVDAVRGRVVIGTPVKRVVCMSTTHVGMLSALQLDSSIVSVSGTRFVYSAAIQKLIQEGHISEAGYEGSFDFEGIARLKPDLIFAYGIGPEVTSWYARMESLHIPVVYLAEYLEEEPLGRAEWIRFIGRMMGVPQKADSFFFSVRASYLSLRKLAENNTPQPVVMTGLPWKDAWNVPSGNSYTARLISDAGGIYWCSDLTARENYELSIEEAVGKAFNAQIWINAGTARSLADIKNTDLRLAAIPAYRNGNVFSNTARIGPGGGNDYWESGTVHPDIILNDLYRILHGLAKQENGLFYFIHLK